MLDPRQRIERQRVRQASNLSTHLRFVIKPIIHCPHYRKKTRNSTDNRLNRSASKGAGKGEASRVAGLRRKRELLVEGEEGVWYYLRAKTQSVRY